MSVSLRQCLISCIPKGNKPRIFGRIGDQFSFYLVSTKFHHQQKQIDSRVSWTNWFFRTQTGFISSLIMLVDFEKALDSVSCQFHGHSCTKF